MAVDQSTRRDIVVIGASAGGVEALTKLVAALPEDLPAAVFIALHVSPSGSVLPAILARHGSLPVAHAEDGDTIQEGRIYVAPPSRHMLIEPNRVRVTAGPRQNGHRPAIDPLFRTAAWSYGPRVAGVVLSGVLDDGTLGCRSITARGGITLVQSPEEATYDDMPRSAIEFDAPSHVATVRELAALLVDLANADGHDDAVAPVGEVPVTEALEGDQERRVDGEVSGFACPECNGVLWQIDEGDLVRFRCRVGHAYSIGAMDAAQGTAAEAALWTALRALEERAALKRRLAERVGHRSMRMRHRYEADAIAAEEHAAVIRQLLGDVTSLTVTEEPVVGGVE